jgi:uncharacterized membrane protein YebE (DUF533 family)
MNTGSLLDQLLGAGKTLLGRTGITTPEGGVSDFGKGAAAGGLAGLLLGNKSGRKLATYGGLAALGMMAWQAYSQSRSGPDDVAPPASLEPSPKDELVVLRAILAAARVDGQIDEREQTLIDREIARQGGDASLRVWIANQLRTPPDPRSIAADVAGDALLASEVYLASALAIGEAGFLERAYLDGLAEHLGLDNDLRQRLDADALSNQSV